MTQAKPVPSPTPTCRHHSATSLSWFETAKVGRLVRGFPGSLIRGDMTQRPPHPSIPHLTHRPQRRESSAASLCPSKRPAELSRLLATRPQAPESGRPPRPVGRTRSSRRENPEGARVLDLGCGDGALLERLMRTSAVRGQGLEISIPKPVFSCVERGVPGHYRTDARRRAAPLS